MKRITAGLVTLAMVLTMLLAMVPAAGATGTYMPVITGYVDVDIITQMVLDEIGAQNYARGTDQIRAVYAWIIANCRREGEADVEYIDMNQVEAQLDSAMEAYEAALYAGQMALMAPFEELDDFGVMHMLNNALNIGHAGAAMAIYRVGTCQHYAALLTLLLNRLGYETYLIAGDFINLDGSRVEHKWNMVFLDGQYYWLDPRMDHQMVTVYGYSGYTYFMLTDDNVWAQSHEWDTAYTDAIKSLHAAGNHPWETWGEPSVTGTVDNSQSGDWVGNQNASENAAYEEGSDGDAWSRCSVWAVPYLATAQLTGLIPEVLWGADMSMPVTRAEFAAIAVSLYEYLTWQEAPEPAGYPFDDCSDDAVLQAWTLGVVNGVTETSFQPEGMLTREQAAAMLGRVYELAVYGWVGDGSELTYQASPFSDDWAMSDYARSYIYFMVDCGILNGFGDGTFEPQSGTTREQALKIAVEMASWMS